jgi:hypothetical protein
MKIVAESVQFDHVTPQADSLPEVERDEASHRD